MSGNTIGRLFTVTTFGENHGPALGAVVDGCPPGLPISEDELNSWFAFGAKGTLPSSIAEPQVTLLPNGKVAGQAVDLPVEPDHGLRPRVPGRDPGPGQLLLQRQRLGKVPVRVQAGEARDRVVAEPQDLADFPRLGVALREQIQRERLERGRDDVLAVDQDSGDVFLRARHARPGFQKRFSRIRSFQVVRSISPSTKTSPSRNPTSWARSPSGRPKTASTP